jgi:hypothetical protein
MDSKGYETWCAVAAYFDGDGNVDIALSKLTLRFRLLWADSWRKQTEQLKRFLESKGVTTEKIVYDKNGANHLSVGRIDAMRIAALEMLRSGCSYKKRRELRALLAYYENKLTGDQVVREFNECVRLGVRSGYMRTSNLPLTYRGARVLQSRLTGAAARGVRQKVDEALRARLLDERARQGSSLQALASKYRLSKSTISRVLRESHGTTRLGRIGDQQTLD